MQQFGKVDIPQEVFIAAYEGEQMSKRRVYHSVPTDAGWAVKINGRTVSNHRTQAASQTAAVKLGHKAENNGGIGQAVFHKANGRISQERTYGADPRNIKG